MSRSLEQVVAPISPSPIDRRLAARELFAFLVQADGGRRRLPNVGAIARARIPADAIDRAPGAVVYRERLRAERARTTGASRGPRPTARQHRALFTVRRPHGDQAVCGRPRERRVPQLAVHLGPAPISSPFTPSRLLWRARGIDGDRVLLGAAHVLTALGFAAMVSRPDPLRDTLLFVRYAEGIVGGLALMALSSLVSTRTGSPARPQLSAARSAPLRLSLLLILFGSGPVRQQRQGEPRSAAADRRHPVAARAVPRRLLRAALGAAARGPQPTLESWPVLSRLNLPRVTYVAAGPRSASAPRSRCSSSRKISGRR